MNDNPIEIHDNEINVEEIMQKIRENIRRKQIAGELPADPDSILTIPSGKCLVGDLNDVIERDRIIINNKWDIRNGGYFINTHRPFIGKFLVKGRQLVNGEVRRYIDPVIFQQTEFNGSAVRLFNYSLPKLGELNLKINHQEKDLSEKITQQGQDLSEKITQQGQDLSEKITQQEQELTNNIKSIVGANFQNVFSQMDQDFRLQLGLAHLLEERIQKGLAQNRIIPEAKNAVDTSYFLFEEQFRGSRESIKQRQLEFIPYFRNCSRVLDIGCGRGEFLEILRDNNIGGFGIDIDADMVAYCKSRQLEVEQGDAITYLETLEDKCLDGIFIDQVVEHLESAYLLRLLALCHQKLKYGYNIVIETVNPLSFISFVNFYIDLTHKRHVHPETLQYIVSASGFRECEKRFFSPVSDESRLKFFEATAHMAEVEQRNVNVYNHNVEILNTILFGAQDYAIIGKK